MFGQCFWCAFECFKSVSRIFQPCFQGSFRDVCETANKMTMKIRKFVWDRFNILCFHGHRFRDPFQTEILRTTVRYTLNARIVVRHSQADNHYNSNMLRVCRCTNQNSMSNRRQNELDNHNTSKSGRYVFSQHYHNACKEVHDNHAKHHTTRGRTPSPPHHHQAYIRSTCLQYDHQHTPPGKTRD